MVWELFSFIIKAFFSFDSFSATNPRVAQLITLMVLNKEKNDFAISVFFALILSVTFVLLNVLRSSKCFESIRSEILITNSLSTKRV